MAWNKVSFVATGAFQQWVCPAGVTKVQLFGYGGGGGGGGGARPYNDPNRRCTGGSGGAGSTPRLVVASVTPATSYDLWVGAGGAYGAGASVLGNPGTKGNAGGGTSFNTSGNPIVWAGGGGGIGGQWSASTPATEDHYTSSSPSEGSVGYAISTKLDVLPRGSGDGGCGRNSFSSIADAVAPSIGVACLGGMGGASGGVVGGEDAPYHGGGPGGGGGGGFGGVGGVGGGGGLANAGGAGNAGTSGTAAAVVNSGAGGGGGGSGGDGPGGGGVGRNGGSGADGLLIIYWWT